MGARRAGIGAAIAAAVGLSLAFAAGAGAQGADFSFFGVRFGMTRAEIDQKWLPLSGGLYAASSAAVRQIRPAFTNEGRLYEFTFSVDLNLPDDPPALVNQAFQEVLNASARKNADLIVNLSVSRDGNQVTITHGKLRDAYLKHLQGKISSLLQP